MPVGAIMANDVPKSIDKNLLRTLFIKVVEGKSRDIIGNMPAFKELVNLVIESRRFGILGEFMIHKQSVEVALMEYYISYVLDGISETIEAWRDRDDRDLALHKRIENALFWLIEDLDLMGPPTDKEDEEYFFSHSVALLGHVSFKLSIDSVKLDESIRIRRLTPFEDAELGNITFPAGDLEKLTSPKIDNSRANRLIDAIWDIMWVDGGGFMGMPENRPVYVIEGWEQKSSKLPKPHESPSSPIRSALCAHEKNMIQSIYNALSSIRLLTDSFAGIELLELGREYVVPAGSSLVYISQNVKPEVRPHDVYRPGSMNGDIPEIANHAPVALSLEQSDQLKELYNAISSFRKHEPQTDFHQLLERALWRYSLALIEYYDEDAVIDLAICLELLTKTSNSKQVSYVISPFISIETSTEVVQAFLLDFMELRHKIVHGSMKGKKKIEEKLGGSTKYMPLGRCLVRACLRNALLYSINAGIPSGNRGFKELLQRCADEPKFRNTVQTIIPQWSFDEVSDLEKSF